MEKRALLAFVLIIMTWIGYYYLVYPMYTTSPNLELTEETSNSNPRSSFSGGPSFSPVDPPDDFSQDSSNLDDRAPPVISERNALSIESTGMMFAESWDRSEQVALLQNESPDVISKDIVIESEYFRGVINTRGANVTSWQLKKYQGLDTPWVELIPQDREFGPEIILTSEEGPYSFQNVVYDSDQDLLNLNEGRKQGSIVFSGRTNKGLTIKKQYIFNHDNYVFEIKVNIDGGGFIPLGSKYYLRWGNGIRITEQDSERDLQAFKGFAQIGNTVIGEDGLGTSIEDPRPETIGDLRWTGVRSKYFLIALIPHGKISNGYRLNGRPVNDGIVQDRQISAELSMNLSLPLNDTFLIYLGPVHYETLER
ncbi:MAG: membrane protein insertase YidC, partial [Candidatus Latescibacteria bacterium]|nr:membrane protein insertase YidC [Candidatus Latescibacterota bacterium]